MILLMPQQLKEQMKTLERCEKIIAPLRERAVLAEAVVEAVMQTMDSNTPEKVRAAVGEWLYKFGGNIT